MEFVGISTMEGASIPPPSASVIISWLRLTKRIRSPDPSRLRPLRTQRLERRKAREKGEKAAKVVKERRKEKERVKIKVEKVRTRTAKVASPKEATGLGEPGVTRLGRLRAEGEARGCPHFTAKTCISMASVKIQIVLHLTLARTQLSS